jgi:hypothetical protein
MNVTLSLSPEIEDKLRRKAKRFEKTLEQYLLKLAEDAASTEPTLAPGEKYPEELSAEEWIARWHEFCNNAPQRNTGFVDDSRESIYEGRGE